MSIAWITSFEEAYAIARKNNKLILLDFFNPN
jgi:hypothetical protein